MVAWRWTSGTKSVATSALFNPIPWHRTLRTLFLIQVQQGFDNDWYYLELKAHGLLVWRGTRRGGLLPREIATRVSVCFEQLR